MAAVTDTAYDRVAHALESATGYRAPNEKAAWRCPAHDDSHASLSVSRGQKGAVLYCHAGCDVEQILDAIGLTKADLFDDPPEKRNGSDRRDIVATYDYTDEHGQLLFQVVRMVPKTFRQRRRDPAGEWQWNIADTRRVLYRLPRVVEAVQRGHTIYVVEGEKDVHAIEAAGGTATCNPGGAGKWRDEYSRALAGANVVIVADNDAPGLQHAHQVEASLLGVRANVRIVTARAGKDAADHLSAGHTLEDFAAYPPAAPHTIKRPFERVPIDLRSPPADIAMLHDWLYGNGCLTVLQSEPGVGKSWLALLLSCEVIAGGGDVVYIDEEGGRDLVHQRLAALGADPDAIAAHFWYYEFEHRDWSDDDMAALVDMLDQIPNPQLAVLDSLPDFLAVAGGDEDKAKDVTKFIKQVCGAFRERGCAQLLLDHLPKPERGTKAQRSRYSRGSGAKLGKADATLLLEAEQEFDDHTSGLLRLWKTKDRRGRLRLPNLGRTGTHITVTVSDGHIEFVDEPEAENAGWDGPTECMNAVVELLRRAPGTEFSKRRLVTSMRAAGHTFRDGTIHEAAERLALQHRISYRKGPKNSDLYSHQQGDQTTAATLDEEDF